MLVLVGLLLLDPAVSAVEFGALADTREANSGISTSFQMAAVLVSLIVLGSAFRNSRRRRRVSRPH